MHVDALTWLVFALIAAAVLVVFRFLMVLSRKDSVNLNLNGFGISITLLASEKDTKNEETPTDP